MARKVTTQADGNENVRQYDECGGYTTVANWLSEMTGGNVSRQSVWQWWNRRDKTGFPAGYVGVVKSGYKRRQQVFLRSDVEKWWESYRRRSHYRWSETKKLPFQVYLSQIYW